METSRPNSYGDTDALCKLRDPVKAVAFPGEHWRPSCYKLMPTKNPHSKIHTVYMYLGVFSASFLLDPRFGGFDARVLSDDRIQDR